MVAANRWGKIGLGLELCTRAIKKEYFKSEYYLNLGKVYLHAKNKKGALTVFTKALRFDPDNDEIHEMLIVLGLRKRQVIPFFKRSNILNRILGVFFRRTLPGMMRKKPPGKATGESDNQGTSAPLKK
jgi:tetratricopeptide (TPR) repeat protein